MTDETFDQEHAAILATAVGIARLKLHGGDAKGALEALDSAVAATRELRRKWMLSFGYSAADVDAFLGGFDAEAAS